MKTPREILLSHHSAAQPKLDAIRNKVLCDRIASPRTSTDEEPAGFVAQVWVELFWSSKRLWLGFAATWLLLGIVNIGTSWSPGGAITAKTKALPSPEIQMVLLEQQRLRMELLEIPATLNQTGNDAKKANRPRSELLRHINPTFNSCYS